MYDRGNDLLKLTLSQLNCILIYKPDYEYKFCFENSQS